VHIAKDPDVGSIPPPEAIPMPPKIETSLAINIPFVPLAGNPELSDNDAYENGKEFHEEGLEFGAESIYADFGNFMAVCDQPGYTYDSLIFDTSGNDVLIRATNVKEESLGRIRFGIHLDHINFHGMASLQIKAQVTWVPGETLIDDINSKNNEKITEFNERTKHEYHKALVEASRERIKLASNIEPRKFEELREEERIVVYRSLIQEILTKDIPMPDDRTRHVVSELLNTIFDIDKMLYFVAPEWWRPRLHQSHQKLSSVGSTFAAKTEDDLLREFVSIRQKSGGDDFHWVPVLAAFLGRPVDAEILDAFSQVPLGLGPGIRDMWLQFIHKYRSWPAEDTVIAPSEVVTWGGTSENRADNYYITEESVPARFGSSLGWLLQLDGDNMRNAFLNAPWVKAVIPIRPGKERAAINWLKQLHVEGTDGLDAQYDAPDAQLKEIRKHAGHQQITIDDAINYLCDVVATKHENSLKVGRYPGEETNDDNRVSATPIDKVYEHGFYPLQGGFRVMPAEDFEVFDQWVEVLPTDQIVPIEVTYDPKTGRQV
jgi:hypothetical protein